MYSSPTKPSEVLLNLQPIIKLFNQNLPELCTLNLVGLSPEFIKELRTILLSCEQSLLRDSTNQHPKDKSSLKRLVDQWSANIALALKANLISLRDSLASAGNNRLVTDDELGTIASNIVHRPEQFSAQVQSIAQLSFVTKLMCDTAKVLRHVAQYAEETTKVASIESEARQRARSKNKLQPTTPRLHL